MLDAPSPSDPLTPCQRAMVDRDVGKILTRRWPDTCVTAYE
jgi:hypothetical protein